MAQTTKAKIQDLKPTGIVLNEKQSENIAAFIKSCKVATKNLETIKKHYRICSEREDKEQAWWQRPLGIVSISLSTLILGVAAGSQL